MDHVFTVSTSRNTANARATEEVDPPILIASNTASGGSGILGGATGSGGLVDVVNNFYWTYSKLRESRTETPRIIMKEKRLKTNALISQLKYSYGVAKSNVRAGLNALPSSASNLLKSWFNKAKDSGVGQNVTQYTKDVYSKYGSFLKDDNDVYTSGNPYLYPYQNLYITEPTGWEFHMPYFDNYNNSLQNGFSQDVGSNPFLGILKDASETLTDIAEVTSALRNPTQITFVERAKFYNYPTEGEEFSFSFPLINTGSATFDDVVRNWELVFLLMYNNKPGRKNKSLIEPPPVYQVEIPGVKFLPFCYISNMSVSFKGTRREIKFGLSTSTELGVDIGSTNPANLLNSVIDTTLGQIAGFTAKVSRNQITTIVPDAYVINITVKSLIPESKNFMYSVLNKRPVVTTSSSPSPGNSNNNPFLNSAQQNTNSPNSNPIDTPVRAPGLPNTSSR